MAASLIEVRISYGAPFTNKTGHIFRGRAAAHHKPLQHRLSSVNTDFRIVDFDLVNDCAQIGAAL